MDSSGLCPCQAPSHSVDGVHFTALTYTTVLEPSTY